MKGVVLETEVKGGKWVTTREAVQRFKDAALPPPNEDS